MNYYSHSGTLDSVKEFSWHFYEGDPVIRSISLIEKQYGKSNNLVGEINWWKLIFWIRMGNFSVPDFMIIKPIKQAGRL